jgi:hypothetical protein
MVSTLLGPLRDTGDGLIRTAKLGGGFRREGGNSCCDQIRVDEYGAGGFTE